MENGHKKERKQKDHRECLDDLAETRPSCKLILKHNNDTLNKSTVLKVYQNL